MGRSPPSCLLLNEAGTTSAHFHFWAVENRSPALI